MIELFNLKEKDMPWIFLVQGYHYTHNNVDDPDELNEVIAQLEQNEQYVQLVLDAKKAGLMVNSDYSYDDGYANFFFGKELGVGRHIYQGKTVSASLANNLQSKLDELNAQLGPILQENGFELEGEGIVLNQFD
jgi:hypothetical protein